MNITSLTARCGLTLPHPRHQYASVRVDLEATIAVQPWEDPRSELDALEAWVAEQVRRRAEEFLKEEDGR